MADPFDEDYKAILDKISQDKEERQKNLEELRKRKKELERKHLISNLSPEETNTKSPRTRQTFSSERKNTNKIVYEHLQGFPSNMPKQLKPQHFNRIEEDEAYQINKANANQVNRLKMVDKKTRYANLVKEIFSPTVDLTKRQEIEDRVFRSNKSRSAYGSKEGSVEPVGSSLSPSHSKSSLRSVNPLLTAGKSSLSQNHLST